VSAGANIAGSKVNPDFGSQNVKFSGVMSIDAFGSPGVSRFGMYCDVNTPADGGDFGIYSTNDDGSYLHPCISVSRNSNNSSINGNTYVNGNLTALSCCQSSDSVLKKNILHLDHALDKIKGINAVTFEWKKNEFPKRNFPEGEQIGFIAQNVEKEYPELVGKDKDGYKTVAYDKMTPVLLEAIKEQQSQIDALKSEIEELKHQKDR
jgi:Chaperone of endosialidase